MADFPFFPTPRSRTNPHTYMGAYPTLYNVPGGATSQPDVITGSYAASDANESLWFLVNNADFQLWAPMASGFIASAWVDATGAMSSSCGAINIDTYTLGTGVYNFTLAESALIGNMYVSVTSVGAAPPPTFWSFDVTGPNTFSVYGVAASGPYAECPFSVTVSGIFYANPGV